MCLVPDDELNAARKQSKDALMAIATRHGWLVERQFTYDVPDMGLPCDMLGPYVYTVRNADGHLLGYSQLGESLAIAAAMVRYDEAQHKSGESEALENIDGAKSKD